MAAISKQFIETASSAIQCCWFTQKGSFMHWNAAMSVLDLRGGGITVPVWD